MSTAKGKQQKNEQGKKKKFNPKFMNIKSKEVISIEEVQKKCENFEKVNTTTLKMFKDIPLSEETLKGLEECEYFNPTEIQRDSLPYSLLGYDLVGAAKTGSGKTLALVIPLLECLWKARWLRSYGTGALIISPTRELALQTFTCINHVGKYHNFSCALLIGGTDVAYERNRLGTVNIIVCTPGRLLQHMDENEHLSTDQLQMLIIDEADRILDMGFSKQINAIVGNLPHERQTLLFSATQTKNVKDLTRVCTKDPVFVSVHENSTSATPDQLRQSYLVCEEQDKMNTVWSFVQMHKKHKLLIFVSSCKQARFITDSFRHLRPGIPVMGLWGGMNQTKRVDVFQKFEDAKKALMIATDVASRGLDFPDVDWVIQLDAPATVDDYIHRVGRTARMGRKGHAVTFLTSYQENGMIQLLKSRNIEVNKLIVDPKALKDIRSKLQAVLAQFAELNQFAQKSLVGYLRSVYLMSDKSIFNVESIDAAAFADSYGLASVPRVRFLSKKGISLKGVESGSQESDDEDKKEQTKNATSTVAQFTVKEEEDEEEDLFVVKKADVFNVLKSDETEALPEVKGRDAVEEEKKAAVTKVKAAKKILNKGVAVNKKKVFDEEGESEEPVKAPDSRPVRGLNIEEAIAEMKTIDKEDRQRLKERKRLLRDKEMQKKKPKESEELDLQDDDAGSGINIDADLDWLPDPDAIHNQQSDAVVYEDAAEEPKKKKRRADVIKDAEAEALALLSPF